MRILPAVYSQRNFVNNSKNMATNKVENKTYVNQYKSHIQNYTGVASADLAYASMFDSAIARDLKLMGLI